MTQSPTGKAGRPRWWTFLVFPAAVVFVASPIAWAMHAQGKVTLPFNPAGAEAVIIPFQLLALGSPVYFAALAAYWWVSHRRMQAVLSLVAIGIWALATALLFFLAIGCVAGCDERGSVAMVGLYGITLLGMSWLAHFVPPAEGDTEETGHEPA